MDEHKAIEILSGGGGVGSSILRGVLRTASVPYSAAMRARRWMYTRGVLPSAAAGAPVICVGNITTGGTGKTPMVAWVVSLLKNAGKTPAILSRGYKASDGLSDEAQLLGQLTGAPVHVNPDRVAGAKAAVAAGADVLVMDDGFQHCRLRRDLDIVLIDATQPFGFGACLPRGLLREPLAALRQAGAIVITRSDEATDDDMAALRQRLGKLAPDASLSMAVHRPTAIVNGSGRHLTPQTLAGRKVMAFCGIARPESFFATVRELGADIAGTLALSDHAAYDAAELQRVRAAAAACDADALVTTQKDAVKLGEADLGAELLQLAIEIDIVEGKDALEARIRKAGDHVK